MRSGSEVESAGRLGGPVTVLERVRVRERRVRLTALETLEVLDTERADWGLFGMEMLVSGDEESMLKAWDCSPKLLSIILGFFVIYVRMERVPGFSRSLPAMLLSVLPPSLLAKWQLLVALTAVFNTVQNYMTLNLTRRMYNNVSAASGMAP